ncbi:MAG: hypothetical protein ACREXM_16170 [Gammaproteobacteria bacterium]
MSGIESAKIMRCCLRQALQGPFVAPRIPDRPVADGGDLPRHFIARRAWGYLDYQLQFSSIAVVLERVWGRTVLKRSLALTKGQRS